MTNTYYTSLSGMLAASYGLQNTSNNVANMQSPGFKRSDVFYSSLGNGSSDLLGSGVQVGGTTTNFCEGKYFGTGNPSHLAIVGSGFFIIKLKNNELAYTRNGDFEFNNYGVLVDKRSGGEVQGYNPAGNLVSIHQYGPKTTPGKPTSMVYLKGQFIRIEKSEEEQKEPGPFKSKYKNIEFSLDTIYDKEGKSHVVTLEFQSTPVLVNGDNPTIPDNGTSWDLVKVTYDGVSINFKEQQIHFSGLDNAADADHSSIQCTLNTGQAITLKFGTPMDGADQSVLLKDNKQNPEGTKVEITQNDGYGLGNPLEYSFDDNGQIIYHYDNGQQIKGVYVSLARFENANHQLISMQDSLFRAHNNVSPHIGRANQNGLGTIQAKQLESSNVDSTMEFANIVVLQRMFQACSQIMNIDKQLFEELENKS